VAAGAAEPYCLTRQALLKYKSLRKLTSAQFPRDRHKIKPKGMKSSPHKCQCQRYAFYDEERQNQSIVTSKTRLAYQEQEWKEEAEEEDNSKKGVEKPTSGEFDVLSQI
jgi:hypothetical protein